MANLKNLSERIKSVTSIQQVTKAMKMVAAAKVKKAQDKMEISRPYARNTQELICRILPQISSTDISLVEKRNVNNIGMIIVTSDRGFAGSFNSSVIRLAEKEIEKIGKDKVQLFCLGKKASEYFSKRDYNVKETFFDFWKDMSYDTASDISKTFISAFENQDIDEVHVIYNRFRTLASQDLIMEKVLPVDFSADYNITNYKHIQLSTKEIDIYYPLNTNNVLKKITTIWLKDIYKRQIKNIMRGIKYTKPIPATYEFSSNIVKNTKTLIKSYIGYLDS